MKRVLILCTGNSCRSQMAEALWNELGGGNWQGSSAGSNPAGYVHPKAIAAMAERGIDISRGESKHLREFLDQPLDLVVTVCDSARDACPTFPTKAEVLHWPFPDPAYAEGTDEEKMEQFRQVRDAIAAKISSYLNA